jgi:hypothetical protein
MAGHVRQGDVAVGVHAFVRFGRMQGRAQQQPEQQAGLDHSHRKLLSSIPLQPP